MLFAKQIDVFGTSLESYRGCFSKPQWNHFKTYMHGLLPGEKSIQELPVMLLMVDIRVR